MRNLGSRMVGAGIHLCAAQLLCFSSFSACFAQDPDPAGGARPARPIATVTTPPAGNKWALLIGVNEYQQAGKLSFCVDDMQLLAEALIKVGGYEPARIGFLSNSAEFHGTVEHLAALPAQRSRRADLVDIRNAVRDLLRLVQPGDTLLIAFSGHGAVDPNGNSFLLTLNADPDDLPATAVPLSWLLKEVKQSQAAQKLVILDACHSGGAVDLVDSLGQDTPELGAGTEADHPGMVLLVSCLSNQVSSEFPRDKDDDLRQGLFSHFIVSAFSGDPKADKDDDGQITAVEAYVFAREGVKRIANQKDLPPQTPAWKVVEGSPNFVIAPRKETLTRNSDLELQTLPGLTGGWWFDEMPLLAPRVRLLIPAKQVNLVESREGRPDVREVQYNFLHEDVQGIKQQLEKAANALIGLDGATEALVPLKRLSGDESPGDLATVQRRLVDLLIALPPAIKEPTDDHLLANLYGQLRDNESAGKTFIKALNQYKSPRNLREQRGLYALCLSDYAKFLGENGEHLKAIEQYDLACATLGDQIPPAFQIYCLCSQANLLRDIGQWDAAEDALKKAAQTAETKCPPGHPLQAHVYERTAWFNMDRWNVKTADELFARALVLREDDFKRGNRRAQPFIFHNRHGQLMANRYLAGLAPGDLEQEYSKLIAAIKDAIGKLERNREGPITTSTLNYKRELRTRVSNSYDRAADLHLFSSEPSTLIADLVKASPSPGNQHALGKATTFLRAAVDEIMKDEQLKKEKSALARLRYKQAIVFALRSRFDLAVPKLKEADNDQNTRVEAKSVATTTEAGKEALERPIHQDLAWCIVNLALSAKADATGNLLDRALFMREQASLRSTLVKHVNAHERQPKKREEVELLLLASGLLTASHALSATEPEVRTEDIQRLAELTNHLNSWPHHLRRYLRPYYCVAIRSAITAGQPDLKVVSNLVLQCKYGEPPDIDVLKPVIIFFADQSTMLAIARLEEQWSLYQDCFGLAADVQIVEKEPFVQLIKALTDLDGAIQLFWDDPDLKIQRTQFPPVANTRLRLEFLPGGD